MNILKNMVIIGVGAFVLISGELLLHKDMISFTPWKTSGTLQFVAYGTGNTDRIGIIANARSSVLVLNADNELIYQLDAKAGAAQSFIRAEILQFDEHNNLYILDTQFGGVFEQSYERVLKYAQDGAFLGEIYRYTYSNHDFSITRGKLHGMTYYQGDLYLVRLEAQGFWLERVHTVGSGNVESLAFVDYPHAFRDVGSCGINPGQKELALITKSGFIKQYDFFGTLSGTWAGTEPDSLPWWVIYGPDDTLIYTDLHTAEIVCLDTKTGKPQVLFTTSPDHPYYVLSTTEDLLFAASFADNLLIRNKEGRFETLETYYYAPWFTFKQKVLFVLCLLDIPPFLLTLAALLRGLVKLRWTKTSTLIFTLGIGITFGAGIATVLIIDKMQEQYNESIFSGLENISRFMANKIDLTLLDSLAFPRDYENEAYQALRGQLANLFAHTQFKGKRVYQRIWKMQEGRQYLVYDLENSAGMFYPDTTRDASSIKKAFESASYEQGIEVNASGRWLYACGPLADSTGTVIAVIETGYDLRAVQAEIRHILITTVILSIAVLLGSIWLLIFALLIISNR
jgi:hypothetical protein